MCVQRQANMAGRGLENLFRVRMTGWLTPLRRHGRSPKTLSAASGYATRAY